MRGMIAMAIAGLLVAGCSEGGEQSADSMARNIAEPMETTGAAEAPPMSREASGSGGESFPVSVGEIPTGTPQIAYVYEYGFRIVPERITALQQAHADLCEAKGPRICRIMSMNSAGSEGDYAYGSLQLAVASSRARAFGKELAALAESADGKQISTSIGGEDLSRQIVDTEASLRARTVLRDRLMDVLETRRGTVEELVAAERSVAQVNQEIDQARSWLNEMRSRVDFSRVNISYQSGQPAAGGFMEPIRGAVGQIGTILGTVIGALILLLTIAVPVALLVFAVMWLRRRFSLWPRRASPGSHADEADAAEIDNGPVEPRRSE